MRFGIGWKIARDLLCAGAMTAGVTLAIADEAQGCVYSQMIANFNYWSAVYSALPPGPAKDDAEQKMCRIRKKIECKFKDRPGKPTPPLPAGAACPAKDNGGGRGGGGGGGGGTGGSTLGMSGWVRNHHPAPCIFGWEVIADITNPPGFSVTPATGSLTVPAFGMTQGALIPFDVMIAPGTPSGSVGYFDLFLVDSCTDKLLGTEYSRFSVTVLPDVCIVPLTPLVPIISGTPASVIWRVTNKTLAPVMKSYFFTSLGDSASLEELNNGFRYFIQNAFPADKSVGGGSATIGPGEFLDIRWDDILSSEFCDPEMLGCCGIVMDGAMSCIITPNDVNGSVHPCVTQGQQLLGSAMGGSVAAFIQSPAGNWFLQQPTAPGDTLPDIIDRLAFQMIQQSQSVNWFNFQPVVAPDVLGLMLPPGAAAQFQSNDAGLVWQSMPCEQGNCCDLPGDADNGGDVNIGDALHTIEYIFQGGSAAQCSKEADADGGGDINIGDALWIIDYIFQGGGPPICAA